MFMNKKPHGRREWLIATREQLLRSKHLHKREEEEEEEGEKEEEFVKRLEDVAPEIITPKKIPYGVGERPNLAKAIQMHHTKAKHEVGNSHKAGFNEFQRQFTQMKKKPQAPQTSELQSVLMRRKESTNESIRATQNPLPEFQQRFSHLRRDE
eukprot:m.57624 g.57624  ORF g.57624 m.57624 type:complete len:153 (-) comp7832_c1_seq1:237-695(-)